MSILFFIIPLSLILVGLAVWAFVWAVNHDQFEDLDRAASSILFDDDIEESKVVDSPQAIEPQPGEGQALESPAAGPAKEVR